MGRLGSYRFSHELLRDVVYTELGAARRQVLHQRALALLQSEGARAAELAVHALAAGEAEEAYRSSVQAGDEAVAVFAVEDAIGHYEQARAWLQEQKRLQTVLPTPDVEHLYVSLGQAYTFLNAWEKAQEAYEELLAYAQQKPLPTLVSMTLNRLAILADQQSKDKRQVQALLEEARQVAQTSSDQRVLAETAWNLTQLTADVWEDPTRALPHGEHALALARGIHDKELEARSLCTLGVIHLLAGDLEEAMHALEAALALYALLRNEQAASRELSDAHVLSGAPPTQRYHHIHQTASFHSLPFFAIGAPLTQPLTNRASEALCWAFLALAQANAGQVQPSIRSGRRALALSKEIKNVWVQITSTLFFTNGLLDAGAYEEALGLMQHAIALARPLPPNLLLQSFLPALGRTYHALQQWEEARSTLEEAEAMAERLDLRPLRVSALSQLCMNFAVAGQWGQAHTYALQAMALRKSIDPAGFLPSV